MATVDYSVKQMMSKASDMMFWNSPTADKPQAQLASHVEDGSRAHFLMNIHLSHREYNYYVQNE